MIALGDTVTFQVWLDNYSAQEITAYEFYLTLDPAVFKPLFFDIDTSISDEDTVIVYRPFTPGTTLIRLGPQINHTHGDVWSEPYVDINDMPGFQLDYFQRTPVAPPSGNRQYFTSSGVAASFTLVVVGFPDDPSGLARITFDNQYVVPGGGGRQARYWLLGSGGTPSYFGFLTHLEILVAGVIISPSLPDTLILPGQDLNVWLGGHFSTGIAGLDSTDAIWSEDLSYPGRHYPAGASFTLIDEPGGPTTRVELTNTAGVHDSLRVMIQVELTDPVTLVTYQDQQVLRAIVDNPPVFTAPLPSFTYDEDDSLTIVSSDIFTDADDGGTNISVWLEPSSPIRVNYVGGAGTIAFSADTNYFSIGPYDSARLFIADVLGVTIDSLLRFTVNSVNDPPVVSLDSVSALGDTLVIHRNTPDTLDLDLFVFDPDDDILNWSLGSSPPSYLSATFPSVNHLRLLAADNAAFVDIDLILTATDDSSAVGSDILVVSIRPWPPEIIIVEDIRINSQDAPSYHLSLADWVDDLDTQPANMTWSFRALDAVTGAVDPYVTFAPSTPLTGDTVSIRVTQIYHAIDLLEMTVTDDSPDSYTDTDTARLYIFESDAPMIYPLLGLTIYRDTTYAGILDLDDYVADILDDPAAINWTFTGGDSLASFYIDPSSHEVTITTNSTFIGNLTVSLVATNSRGLRDTSDLAILVSRLNDGPPLWYALPDEVEVVYGWTTDLFNYSQVCYDETPTDQIIFTPFYNTDSLTVTIASPDSVKLETPISDKKYTTRLYFSAEDDSGRISYSDTITVNVKDSFSPVWQRIPIISLKVGGTYSGLFLQYYVSDRDTPDSLLTIDVVNLNPSLITTSYNSATTKLTVQAGLDKGDRWLFLTATDDKSNTATAMIHVVVFAVTDDTPPDGDLTYFFNPATDRWIHYVVVADSTSSLTWDYSYGILPNKQDFSDSLSFAMQDSLPGTLTWIAPYHFRKEGSYTLIATIADAYNNKLTPTKVLSVGFSKAIGGVLTSPDQQLTVSYPPAPIPNGKLFIISEDYPPDSTGQPIAEIAGTGVNEKTVSQAPATVYSLDSNLPEPILVTLTYNQKRDTDPYYSFYEMDGDRLVKIETYTSTDGHFEAAAKLDRDIVFAPSDTPARNAPLPDAELFCYPNPFNATIQVRFLLRWPDRGRIVIYNLLGREIYTSPRQLLEPGVHAFSWHSIDKRGLPAPSGVYFIRLETDGGKIVTRKVTLLK